jgi:hypothetical protein
VSFRRRVRPDQYYASDGGSTTKNEHQHRGEMIRSVTGRDFAPGRHGYGGQSTRLFDDLGRWSDDDCLAGRGFVRPRDPAADEQPDTGDE